MHLYDTASGTVRPLEIGDRPVSLYVCGITPYDAAHLGHAFTYHVFDVITRRLLAAGRAVRSVRNITDADDDIFRVARERRVEWVSLVDEQVARFDGEMAAIGILPVTVAPRATAHVADMVDWISRLENAGFAYARDGWVYFEVSRFAPYGRLGGLNRMEMIALARDRGANPDDTRKRDPLDFVLWQPSLSDEPRWPSPWGDGRPGWHIECSVLARRHLDPTIDIHGGGDDLIYPHHESEIAQAEAIGPRPFVRHWVHVAMVCLDGVKMSKSLGNLVFIPDVLRQADAGAVRLLLASHHYRQQWGYSVDEVHEASARHGALATAATGEAVADPDEIADLETDFFARLDDDLDTPGALRVLDRVAAAGRTGPRTGAVPVGDVLARLGGIVGLQRLRAAPQPVADA